MDIQFGLENEIGITRQNPEGIDVVAESIGLVRSATAEGVRLRWDYNFEDPHLDARGFRVKELKQDSDEAEYFAQDASRSLSNREIKSDYVLKNGARFYNDHAHPEYCTPECSNLFELLQQDFAGDEVLMSCARTINQGTDNPVILFKNNSDFQGHSYGCHENYLLPRILPWDTLACGTLAFLVTRQVFCGAGKFGWEEEDRFLKTGFQISQRSDFFSVIQSVDTMQRRPIVNTRDEPHANPEKYRRFPRYNRRCKHVSVCDLAQSRKYRTCPASSRQSRPPRQNTTTRGSLIFPQGGLAGPESLLAPTRGRRKRGYCHISPKALSGSRAGVSAQP